MSNRFRRSTAPGRPAFWNLVGPLGRNLRWLCMGLLGVACIPEQAPQPALRLSGFRQAGDRNVYLNEPLVFDFNAELDPVSITVGTDGVQGSLRVLDPSGLPVKGSLAVSSRQIVFRARLPLLSDLSDGGFRPGTEYTVELVGFPRPDGIRSKQAGPLESNLRLGFRTALLGGPKPLFDPFLELGGGVARMELGESMLAPSEPISILSSYAIDPRSLSSKEFVLTFWDDLGELQGDDVIALHPRLVENHGLTELGSLRNLARLELVPGRALRLGRYILSRVEPSLQSLSGQKLLMRLPVQGLGIEVAMPEMGRQAIGFSRSQWGRHDEAFDTDGSLYSALNASETSLRLLAAAGDGSAGELLRAEDWSGSNDLHASRVHLELGSQLDLSELQGCVVLRAQAAVTLDGSVVRRRSEGEAWSDTTPFPTRGRGRENLSDWIVRMQELGEPWTVIVAGADLRISGELQVEGPLLLVAGGAIRVYDGGRIHGQVIYKSPEGGNNIGQVHDAPLLLDAPLENPLVLPVSYGLLTPPFRPQAGVRAWLGAEVDAELGETQLELQFVGVRDLPSGRVAEVGPVASIDQLRDCQGIRLLLRLTVPAAEEGIGPWTPPLVRRVNLSWEPMR